MENRELSIWDMFWAICLKWRSVLVCGIIGTILVGGFDYVQSTQSSIESTGEITIESLEKGLEYKEKYSADLYCEYRILYDNQMEYNAEAPIMNLNANALYKGEISYYVDNYYEVEYPVIEKNNNVVAIIDAYKAELKTEQFANKVNEVLGIEDSNSYGIELIDVDRVYDIDDTNENKEKQGVFTVFVYADDEETCNELSNLVKHEFENKKSNVTEKLGKHDIMLLHDTVQFTSDSVILDYQKRNIEAVQSYASSMNSHVTQFTDAQKQYVDLRLKKEHGESGADEDGASEVVAGENSVNVKMLLIGFFAGALAAFAIWVIIYILSSKIRLEDDFERNFESKLLGNVSIDSTKKKYFAFLDRFFQKLRHFNKRYFEHSEAVDMVAANIRIALQKTENKKVMITGAIFEDDEKKIAEELAERLKKDGIEIVCASPVLYNAESLEKLVEIGQVVLVEKAEKTLYQEVQQEIDICKHQQVNLIGCVVVY